MSLDVVLNIHGFTLPILSVDGVEKCNQSAIKQLCQH